MHTYTDTEGGVVLDGTNTDGEGFTITLSPEEARGLATSLEITAEHADRELRNAR